MMLIGQCTCIWLVDVKMPHGSQQHRAAARGSTWRYHQPVSGPESMCLYQVCVSSAFKTSLSVHFLLSKGPFWRSGAETSRENNFASRSFRNMIGFLQEIACMMRRTSQPASWAASQPTNYREPASCIHSQPGIPSETICWKLFFGAPEVAYALHIDTQILSPQYPNTFGCLTCSENFLQRWAPAIVIRVMGHPSKIAENEWVTKVKLHPTWRGYFTLFIICTSDQTKWGHVFFGEIPQEPTHTF